MSMVNLALPNDAAVAAELARTPRGGRSGKAIEKAYRFPRLQGQRWFSSAAHAEPGGHHLDVTIHYHVVTLSIGTPPPAGSPNRTSCWRVNSTPIASQ
jgi:hypothetical protein